ncbi:162_t:CDS:2 [Entrophospora sp. SA101]|nr:162_t:CDS:2 [Entrophospora sp. SA101]
MRGFTTFFGKENGRTHYLYIAEEHPILDNFSFEKVELENEITITPENGEKLVAKKTNRKQNASNKKTMVAAGSTKGNLTAKGKPTPPEEKNNLTAVAVTQPASADNKQLTQILQEIQELKARITELEKTKNNPQQVQKLNQKLQVLEAQKAQLASPKSSTESSENSSRSKLANDTNPNKSASLNSPLIIIAGLVIFGISALAIEPPVLVNKQLLFMNKSEPIKVLTRQEEIELLQQAQKGKTQEERERAARLLVYYNQSFVKYVVKGFHYPQGEINSDELTAEGIISLPQAIKDFDLTKSENRLASYAATPKKKPTPVAEEEGEEGVEKKIPSRNFPTGIIYYDKDYQSGEKDDKATSLLDTLADDNEQIEQLIQQRETKRKIGDLLAHLEPHEELIVRLFFGIVPANLAQINRLVIEEKTKELKKFQSKEKSPLFAKCSQFFATPHKKEEVAQTLMNREFWEYFREFPELATKTQISRRGSSKTNFANQPVSAAEQKK